MPVLTAAACDSTCPATPFPSATANCSPETSAGGVNDLYFIPCDQVMSEANILDTDWWQALVDGESPNTTFLGAMGEGVGSIARKDLKTDRMGSCKPVQVISATWALTYTIKTFDKSTDKTTHEQVQALLDSPGRYLLIARMCDGDNTVLPIGKFSTSDFNWTVPDNNEENQSIVIELSWVEKGLPKTYTVAGLSAIVPKA